MKKQRASLILIVVLVMSAILAPAAQAQGLVEYSLIFPGDNVNTNVGPAWFTASSDYDGNVTAYLRFVETSEEYRLYLDKLDAYIYGLDPRERVGLRLSGQATTADGNLVPVTMEVSKKNDSDAIVVVAIQLLAPSIGMVFFETMGTITITLTYYPPDLLANAQIELQTVDANGDGDPAESVSGSWSVLADGPAEGRMDVLYEDGTLLGFYPTQGDLFCTDDWLMLELNGLLFKRHPDGGIEDLGNTTVTVVPGSNWNELDDYIVQSLIVDVEADNVFDSSKLRFDSTVDFVLNVNLCP